MHKNLLVLLFIIVFTCVTNTFAQNGCGPENEILGIIPSDWVVPDGPVPFLSFFDEFNTFEKSCNKHDICYGEAQVSQVDCDRQFYTDLLLACEADFDSFMLDYCKNVAGAFFSGVSTFGEMAKKGVVDGEIISVTDKRIDDWLGDDEF